MNKLYNTQKQSQQKLSVFRKKYGKRAINILYIAFCSVPPSISFVFLLRQSCFRFSDFQFTGPEGQTLFHMKINNLIRILLFIRRSGATDCRSFHFIRKDMRDGTDCRTIKTVAL